METKTTEIKEDIKTFFMQTDKVPFGIPDLFNEMEEKIRLDKYHIYGVTECVEDKLIYRACLTENYLGEGKDLNLPYYNIPKGRYVYSILKKRRQRLSEIVGIFCELLKHPDVKKDAICIEDYQSVDQMLFMVEHK